MKYSDHFLITEAWRRAERFDEETHREQLLAQVRAARQVSRQVSLRRRSARLLVQLARRLEPDPKPDELCPNCT